MAKRVSVDKWLFTVILLLVFLGLIMVFSASAVMAQARFGSSYSFLLRQLGWAGAGIAAMLVVMNIDYKQYRRLVHRLHLPRSHLLAAGRRVSVFTTRTIRIAGSSSVRCRFSRRSWPSPPSSFTSHTSWNRAGNRSPTGSTCCFPPPRPACCWRCSSSRSPTSAPPSRAWPSPHRCSTSPA